MTKKLDRRPICVFCGKRLIRYFHFWFEGDSRGTPEPIIGKLAQFGIVQRVWPKKLVFGTKYRETKYWCGEYGDGGGNKFCSRTCAVNWAYSNADVIMWSDGTETTNIDDEIQRETDYTDDIEDGDK